MKANLMAEHMARSIMERSPQLSEAPNNHGNWTYGHGVVLEGFRILWKKTGKKRYFDYIYDNLNHFIHKDGSISTYFPEEFNIDHINNGKLLFVLYEETKEERFKKAIENLYGQLLNHPRTSEGVFWHKKIYPHQIWLDGLYMGTPFYAKYAQFSNQENLYDDVMIQFDVSFKRLYDKSSGLLFHGYDESKEQSWANPETGCSKSFWTRSIGWYVMALVDTYDILPEAYHAKKRLREYLNIILEGLMEQQDSRSRCWYQVTNELTRKGNYLEASGSSMIVYALAKGLRLGLLTGQHWIRRLNYAYQGVSEQFITEDFRGWLNLNHNCKVSGLGASERRDGSFEYYISEPIVCNDQKGLGAFLQAAIEAEEILNQEEVIP